MRKIYYHGTALMTAFVCALWVGDLLAADMPTVMITGTTRGIGFEFAKQYAEKDWNVIATTRRTWAPSIVELAREHKNVTIEYLDVLDHRNIDLLASKYRNTPIDVLINVAGIFGDLRSQFLGRIKHAEFSPFMRTNALGPLKITEAFTKSIKLSKQKKVVAITSLAGSVGADSGGLPGQYFYKTSKTALNMFFLLMSNDLKKNNVKVVLLSPGIVRTRAMPFPLPGQIEPPESISAMIGIIDRLTIADTGTIIRYTGSKVPW